VLHPKCHMDPKNPYSTLHILQGAWFPEADEESAVVEQAATGRITDCDAT